jgi:hypothetical protein
MIYATVVVDHIDPLMGEVDDRLGDAEGGF